MNAATSVLTISAIIPLFKSFLVVLNQKSRAVEYHNSFTSNVLRYESKLKLILIEKSELDA